MPAFIIKINVILIQEPKIPGFYSFSKRGLGHPDPHDPTKLGKRTEGPYNIEQVHVNGTVSMRLRPGVLERINIRCIKPLT